MHLAWDDTPFPLLHIREPLHSLRKAFDRLVHVTVLKAVLHAMADVPLKDHLSCLVQCRLCRADLAKDILTGNVLIDHSVNRLYLSDNSAESAVQICRVHTLLHKYFPSLLRSVCLIITCRSIFVNAVGGYPYRNKIQNKFGVKSRFFQKERARKKRAYEKGRYS